jgi:hypothetical protein
MIGDDEVSIVMRNDAVVQGLSEGPNMRGVEHWASLRSERVLATPVSQIERLSRSDQRTLRSQSFRSAPRAPNTGSVRGRGTLPTVFRALS